MFCYLGDWYCPACVEAQLGKLPFDDEDGDTDDESTSSSVADTDDECDEDASGEETCEYLDELAEEDETEALAEYSKVWMCV